MWKYYIEMDIYYILQSTIHLLTIKKASSAKHYGEQLIYQIRAHSCNICWTYIHSTRQKIPKNYFAIQSFKTSFILMLLLYIAWRQPMPTLPEEKARSQHTGPRLNISKCAFTGIENSKSQFDWRTSMFNFFIINRACRHDEILYYRFIDNLLM